jgi:hypothetical protein
MPGFSSIIVYYQHLYIPPNARRLVVSIPTFHGTPARLDEPPVGCFDPLLARCYRRVAHAKVNPQSSVLHVGTFVTQIQESS